MLSYSAAMDRWVRGERLLKHPRLLFHEREVYSYGLHYLLGRKVEWKGETLVLLNTSKRSLTTSRHQGELAQACRRAHVPFVFVSGRPTGDVLALLQGELATLDETIALMARLARVRPPMVRLRRLQDMALAMRRRVACGRASSRRGGVRRVTMRTFNMRHNNLDWLVHVLHDETCPTPWREDADGEVIKARQIGARVKRPGEVMVNSYLAADFSGALAQVRREDWGVTGSPEAIAWAARLFGAEVRLPSLTRRQKAALATRLVIERWRAWCRDEWAYVEVGVQLLNLDGEVVGDRTVVLCSVCGIESDDEEGIMMAARDAADSAITTYDAIKVAMMQAINSARENDDEVGSEQLAAAGHQGLR